MDSMKTLRGDRCKLAEQDHAHLREKDKDRANEEFDLEVALVEPSTRKQAHAE